MWLPLTLAIAYVGSIALTAVLARTPLAVPLTGRKQQPWRTLLPRRIPAAAPAPEPAGVPAEHAGHGRGRQSRDSSRARRAGGHDDRSERNTTVLTEQIDEAAACRGDAPYLEDAAGAATLTYAGLRDSVRAWARHLDEAGIPPGARVAVRLPDPFGYAARPGRHPGGGPGGGPARSRCPGRRAWRGC